MLGVALVATSLIWFGLTFGLSFIETPLKFQAPGVTLEIALGIGRLVLALLGTVVIIVAVQSVYLLTLLDERTLQIIAGRDLPATSHHQVYVVLELVKLSCLAVGGLYHARTQLAGAG